MDADISLQELESIRQFYFQEMFAEAFVYGNVDHQVCEIQPSTLWMTLTQTSPLSLSLVEFIHEWCSQDAHDVGELIRNRLRLKGLHPGSFPTREILQLTCGEEWKWMTQSTSEEDINCATEILFEVFPFFLHALCLLLLHAHRTWASTIRVCWCLLLPHLPGQICFFLWWFFSLVQIGVQNPQEDVLLLILCGLLEKPCFHQLRTVEQLGEHNPTPVFTALFWPRSLTRTHCLSPPQGTLSFPRRKD